MLQSLLVILNSLAGHLFLTVKKKSECSPCFCCKGNQSQLFIVGAYLKMKALKKMKALRKIAFLIFNASNATDVDIVKKQGLPLVLF